MALKKSSSGKKQPASPPSAAGVPSLRSAEAAFHALRPALDALPRSAVRPPNFNLQAGALVALAAHGLLDTKERRAVVVALGQAGTMDTQLVNGLADVARAAWFVRHKLDLASAAGTFAALPEKLVADATEVRKRMLKVLEYHLDDDPQVARVLGSIRAGQGYMDLANDLLALSDLYGAHKAAIASDKKGYRTGDATAARKLAAEILASLGGPDTPEAQRWRDYHARVYILLDKHYQETMRVGRFLFWYEGGEALFPTLFSATRARPVKKKAPEAAAPPA